MKKAIIFILVLSICIAVNAQEVIRAVRDGDTEEVIRLLKSGKNPNEVESGGERTPLMLTIDGMDPKMAKTLIDQKADVNFKTPNSGITALMFAAAQTNADTASTLAIMKLLLDAGADINAVDNKKWTAVMHAVYEKNNPAVLELLLKHKADVNKVAGDGDFALFMAASEGYADLTRLLLDAGADPDRLKSTYNFKTAPIHAAVEKDHADAVKLLLDHNADVNIKTVGAFGGMTPLHIAVESRNVDMVKLLLKYKPNVNLKDAAGGTPLWYATNGGGDELAEIIGLLQKAGAK